MEHTIENERLIVSVDEKGAELCGLYDKQTETQLLWQGDPAVWSGRSPILFPIVGRLWNDRFRYAGKEYLLSKHGFVRQSLTTPVMYSKDEMAFSLESSEETLKHYPFAFCLTLRFRLEGSVLHICYELRNTDEKKLWYSIGGHPGFQCQTGDRIVFSESEPLVTEQIDGDGYLTAKKRRVSDNGVVIVTPDIFLSDALIFSDLSSRSVTLEKAVGPNIRVCFPDADVLGLWAKPGASYVCIEPWRGINDPAHYQGSFEDKRGITALASGMTDCFRYSVEVL